jgi:hypothetical protein
VCAIDSTEIETSRLDPTVSLEGNLVKRSVKSGRNFKRRFFVLHRNKLTYYDNAKLLKVCRRLPVLSFLLAVSVS